MEKRRREEIKEKLKEQYSFKEYHVEKFCINIEKYINCNVIETENSYYLFGYNGGVENIEVNNKERCRKIRRIG